MTKISKTKIEAIEADIENSDFQSALLSAAQLGVTKYVKYLAELKDANGNLVCNPADDNNRAIRWASSNGQLEIVKYLAELKDSNGNPVCNPADENNEALRSASKNGHIEIVKYLTELKDGNGNLICNPAAANNYAIQFASQNGHIKIVKYLAELKDDNGNFICNPAFGNNCPIRTASYNGHTETVKYLAELKDSNGNPVCNPAAYYNYAIEWAFRNGHKKIVCMLARKIKYYADKYKIWKERGIAEFLPSFFSKMEDAVNYIKANEFIKKILKEEYETTAALSVAAHHLFKGGEAGEKNALRPPIPAELITHIFSHLIIGDVNIAIKHAQNKLPPMPNPEETYLLDVGKLFKDFKAKKLKP